MANPVDVIAVTGEKVFLILEGTEPVTGPVEVSFQLRTDGPDIITLDFWTESLVAEAADQTVNPSAVGQIAWTVNINGSFTMPKSPELSILFFSISGKTASGAPLQVKAGNRLRIPAFKVTPNDRLRRIMKHEFAKQVGLFEFEFDEAPVQAALDELAPEQRSLLAHLDPGSTGNRLVTFITVQKEDNRLMHADTCPSSFNPPLPPNTIKPNATFMVFHCQGVGKEVALVCFTRFFVLNMINPSTFALMRGPQGGKSADVWLSRSNPAPPVFKIGAFNRANFTDGVYWNRVFTPKGKNIMGGNTMHGIINTVGCWMTFRNSNFPKVNSDGVPIEVEMDRILNQMTRATRVNLPAIVAALANVGYDSPTSLPKMMDFDGNYAYTMFLRELVGLKYFTKNGLNQIQAANDEFAHQLFFSNSFKVEACKTFAAQMGNDGNVYHDLDEALKVDPNFKLDTTFIVENALGFKACKKFVDGVNVDIAAADVEDSTWCDLYLYRADDIKSSQFKQAYMGTFPKPFPQKPVAS
jgi:hypothetical protein